MKLDTAPRNAWHLDLARYRLEWSLEITLDLLKHHEIIGVRNLLRGRNVKWKADILIDGKGRILLSRSDAA